MNGSLLNALTREVKTGRLCFLAVKMYPLDPVEIGSTLHISERTGYLLLQFHHPDIPLSLVVGEGDGKVVHERKVLHLIFLTSVEEILRL